MAGGSAATGSCRYSFRSSSDIGTDAQKYENVLLSGIISSRKRSANWRTLSLDKSNCAGIWWAVSHSTRIKLVRHFFTRRTPPFTRALLIESGSRRLLDSLVPSLYQFYGEALEIDLVTCFAGVPEGFRGTVYRIADYTEPASRVRLLNQLKSRNYAAIGIICAAEPIMTKWKWWLAAKIPAK